jgi:hypothetical protein
MKNSKAIGICLLTLNLPGSFAFITVNNHRQDATCVISRHPSQKVLQPSALVTVLQDAAGSMDVLTRDDLIYGTLIALALAFTASFLQGRRNQNDFVLWELSGNSTSTGTDGSPSSKGSIVFDADSWKDISRPDNYILYNRRLREQGSKDKGGGRLFKVEKAWVVVALIALFVPIFSVEIFFALSRQLICGGNPLDQSEWGEYLCSPFVDSV